MRCLFAVVTVSVEFAIGKSLAINRNSYGLQPPQRTPGLGEVHVTNRPYALAAFFDGKQ